MTNEDYMRIAVELAKQAAKNDEVPIAALVVNPSDGEIISSAANESAHSGDATSHAEILAIRRACEKLKTNRLWDLDIYVTLEPCTMCAAAISFARIKNLYYGATDEKGGAVESGVRFFESSACHHKPKVTGGILADDCSEILKNFFRNKR